MPAKTYMQTLNGAKGQYKAWPGGPQCSTVCSCAAHLTATGTRGASACLEASSLHCCCATLCRY